LKEIGVSLGHRRQLLRAIAELPNREKDAPKAAPAALASAAQDMAERRQVTVMFSDLVGSTALSARMDPEDLREVISAYQKCVTEIVQRFGGFVAKYMGDGVLVYFGYPQAHEDDAERAVRAGLQLAAALGDLKTHAALQTRVGIATGLVVVGDLIGSGEAQERGIVGETPNLAARLQGLAQPNSVVVAESTRKLLGNLFELEDLGARDLELIETTKEKMFEPEVNRTAGEIAFKSERDPTTAQAYFERALAVARAQQAKSWELRAAMSMARLWRGQGKPQQGHELLAPVCGWFTEGFDTLDLKEAKALLEELAS
jgi:class 3 adenylate cyclase